MLGTKVSKTIAKNFEIGFNMSFAVLSGITFILQVSSHFIEFYLRYGSSKSVTTERWKEGQGGDYMLILWVGLNVL